MAKLVISIRVLWKQSSRMFLVAWQEVWPPLCFSFVVKIEVKIDHGFSTLHSIVARSFVDDV